MSVTLKRPLRLEFEHFPPAEFDADEVDAQRGKPATEAVRSLLSSRYPDVFHQMAVGSQYDIEMCLQDGSPGSGPVEVPVQGSTRWDDIADECEKQRVALAIAEHVRGGRKQ